MREPISRALASFMHGFFEDKVTSPASSNLKESAKQYVMMQLSSNCEFMWFDEELKALTGIDIFAYPFDKEKGYAWIRTKYVEILVLKMEKMDENEKIVGEFAGLPNLKYTNVNIGDKKHSKYIYMELKKQFAIQTSWLKSYYMSNERFQHFYTKNEIEGFCNRWGIE